MVFDDRFSQLSNQRFSSNGLPPTDEMQLSRGKLKTGRKEKNSAS
jgi:hypothetical protein